MLAPQTLSIGMATFACGSGTWAHGEASFAAGKGTVANGTAQLVCGQWNNPIADTKDAPNKNAFFIIGKGSSSSSKSNAFVVHQSGNVYISGDIVTTEGGTTRKYALNSHNYTITANATDGMFDITGTNGTNTVTYAVAPYAAATATSTWVGTDANAGKFYLGTNANPSKTTRLNYNGYLYATKLYSGGIELTSGDIKLPYHSWIHFGDYDNTWSGAKWFTSTHEFAIRPYSNMLQLTTTPKEGEVSQLINFTPGHVDIYGDLTVNGTLNNYIKCTRFSSNSGDSVRRAEDIGSAPDGQYITENLFGDDYNLIKLIINLSNNFTASNNSCYVRLDNGDLMYVFDKQRTYRTTPACVDEIDTLPVTAIQVTQLNSESTKVSIDIAKFDTLLTLTNSQYKINTVVQVTKYLYTTSGVHINNSHFYANI